MKIKIKKIGFVELGIYCTFLLLPFTLFLNKIVFKDFRIAGIGIVNLMLYVFLCIGEHPKVCVNLQTDVR